MLEHGGRVKAAVRRYGIAEARWLDLSTGINPSGWPVPEPPPGVWQRLPEPDDGLMEAARDYYGVVELLPCAGSQAAIQQLPRLRRPSRVAILAPAYAEHERAWCEAGHQVTTLTLDPLEAALEAGRFEVVVVVNPNNPTGRRLSRERLLTWRRGLVARGGWLVVDEAFMDATPGESLVAETPLSGVVLLRSLGKFFGLAGVRLGFVMAERLLLDALEERLGPWAVSHPARWVARRALQDREWQQAERERLAIAARRLATLLTEAGLPPAGGCGLFQYVETRESAAIQAWLARQAILVRAFDPLNALRFGLPDGEEAWRRLGDALDALRDKGA